MSNTSSTPRILVLGGTRFVGRAVVADALERGFDVTMFHRGRTGRGLFPEAETVLGDRTGDLSELAGRRFDAVIDVAAYQPDDVSRSVRALRGAVGRYVFMSTASVYADHSVPQVEGQDVLALTDATPEDDLYGARKAACEAIVVDGFGDAGLMARSGMIVGPYDPTDRFAHWPRRLRRAGREGGPVLAPGDPADPVQFVDVRDLAGWLVDGCVNALSGAYNVTGAPMRFDAFLGECARTVDVAPELVWASGDWLRGRGVDPWTGVPMWIAAPGWEAANAVDTSRAVADGLRIRPVGDAIAATLAWDEARGGPEAGAEGLSADAEAELLTALRAG